MNRRAWVAFALGIALATACSTASGGYRLESSASVDYQRARRVLTDPPSHVLFDRHRGSRTALASKVILRDCVNVRGGCPREVTVNVMLQPGDEKELLRAYPADSDEEFSFDWVYRIEY